jgi:hypothetical protein
VSNQALRGRIPLVSALKTRTALALESHRSGPEKSLAFYRTSPPHSQRSTKSTSSIFNDASSLPSNGRAVLRSIQTSSKHQSRALRVPSTRLPLQQISRSTFSGQSADKRSGAEILSYGSLSWEGQEDGQSSHSRSPTQESTCEL